MQVMSKHWDYEDDHDWDDDIDYAAMGYVYWYGKYWDIFQKHCIFTSLIPESGRQKNKISRWRSNKNYEMM